MPQPTLDELNGLPDTLDNTRYQLLLGVVPGGGGDTKPLTLKCRNANYPGMSNEMVNVQLHGQQQNLSGRKNYPRTLAVTYVEDVTFGTNRALRNWLEAMRGTTTGLSQGYRRDYTVQSDLVLFDTTGAEVSRATFYYLMPQDIPDVMVSGDAPTAFEVACTFSYDYYTETTRKYT